MLSNILRGRVKRREETCFLSQQEIACKDIALRSVESAQIHHFLRFVGVMFKEFE